MLAAEIRDAIPESFNSSLRTLLEAHENAKFNDNLLFARINPRGANHYFKSMH